MGKVKEIITKYAASDSPVEGFGRWLVSGRDQGLKEEALAEVWHSLEATPAADDPLARRERLDSILAMLPEDSPVKRPRIWRWAALAAAAVAALLLLRPVAPVPESAQEARVAVAEPPVAVVQSPVDVGQPSSAVAQHPVAVANPPAKDSSYEKPEPMEESPSQIETASVQSHEVGKSVAKDKPETITEEEKEEIARMWKELESGEPKPTSRRWTALSFNVSGGGQKYSKSYPPDAPGLPRSIFAGLSDNPEATDVTLKHSFPVTFGLGLAFQLSERYEVQTGIDYTRLYSRIYVSGTDGQSEKGMTLHYVGIPVSLKYSWMRKGGFDLYSSAGGTVAWCVSGSDKHPVQFSANVSGGLQFAIGGPAGIFVEPSVSYHFKDKSDLVTYYSEHPLSLGAKIGLVFNL